MNTNHYGKLAFMVALHFIAMYVLMYAMVNSFDNVFANLNQVYMAGIMTASMGIIEIAAMSSMYPDKRRNVLVVGLSIIALLLFWMLTRQQVAISDEQFIRSMIPHHAGALLMCEQAPLEDQELKDLCESIIKGQQSEIDQMKTILDRL